MMITDIIFSILAIGLIGFLIFLCLKYPNDEPRNIAVYSGSFNPIHIGHKAVIDYLSNEYDWVYVIVTPQNPLKDTIEVSSEERRKAVERALINNGYLNVTVNDIESTLNPPYYTINTLRKLKEQESNNNFKLVIGADCLEEIKNWKSYQDILTDFGVIVFPRGEVDVNQLKRHSLMLHRENPNYKIKIANIKTPNVSSTEIREARKKGEDVNYLTM